MGPVSAAGAEADATGPALHVSCGECGAELRVEAHLRTTVCPYCDAPTVVERPVAEGRPDPALVVGFVLQGEQAADRVREWLRSRSIFAHSGLARARVEKTRAVYLPAYLYGASAHSDYQANIGENYTVTETYTDSKGNTRTRTRTETEWRRLHGRFRAYISDRVVTASKGLPNAELEAVEPFDLRAIRRYAPAMISGWITEEPSLPREQCLNEAHAESLAEVGRRLEAFMPGDKHRDLSHTTTFQAEHAELILLPVWVFSARYAADKPPVRIVVNGQTGKTSGDVPYSWIKITLTVIVVLAIIAVLAVTLGSR